MIFFGEDYKNDFFKDLLKEYSDIKNKDDLKIKMKNMYDNFDGINFVFANEIDLLLDPNKNLKYEDVNDKLKILFESEEEFNCIKKVIKDASDFFGSYKRLKEHQPLLYSVLSTKIGLYVESIDEK